MTCALSADLPSPALQLAGEWFVCVACKAASEARNNRFCLPPWSACSTQKASGPILMTSGALETGSKFDDSHGDFRITQDPAPHQGDGNFKTEEPGYGNLLPITPMHETVVSAKW